MVFLAFLFFNKKGGKDRALENTRAVVVLPFPWPTLSNLPEAQVGTPAKKAKLILRPEKTINKKHIPLGSNFLPDSLGSENSAQSFSDRSFWKSLRVVDVRVFGSWMSAPKCLFFQHLEGPDRSFGPGYPREWAPDVRGISVPKTSSLGWFFVPDSYSWRT